MSRVTDLEAHMKDAKNWRFSNDLAARKFYRSEAIAHMDALLFREREIADLQRQLADNRKFSQYLMAGGPLAYHDVPALLRALDEARKVQDE